MHSYLISMEDELKIEVQIQLPNYFKGNSKGGEHTSGHVGFCYYGHALVPVFKGGRHGGRGQGLEIDWGWRAKFFGECT